MEIRQPNFKNKTILVIGGAGFIGSHVVERVIELGAESVTVLDNFASGKESNLSQIRGDVKPVIVRGDVTDYSTVKKHVEQADCIINEAASKMVVSLKNPFIDLNTNIIGAYNVFQACRESGGNQKIVHASTGSVYGSHGSEMDERTYPKPNSFYGVSKLAGEKYGLFFAKEFGMNISIIRYVHVYGPRQDYSGEAGVVSIFLGNILQDKPPVIFNGGKQVRCFTYVEDQVDATMLLIREGKTAGQDYTVASRNRISVENLAKKIIDKYATKKMEPVYGKIRYGENPYPVFNTSKIEALGWTAKTDFDDGLDRTKQWVAKDIGQS